MEPTHAGIQHWNFKMGNNPRRTFEISWRQINICTIKFWIVRRTFAFSFHNNSDTIFWVRISFVEVEGGTWPIWWTVSVGARCHFGMREALHQNWNHQNWNHQNVNEKYDALAFGIVHIIRTCCGTCLKSEFIEFVYLFNKVFEIFHGILYWNLCINHVL